MPGPKHILFLFVLFFACREKYVPALIEKPTGYLVVEGFINSVSGITSINLSRTAPLSVNISSDLKETKAVVTVEGKTNTSAFPLTESSKGTYTAQLTLNLSDQYRLHIKTASGGEYVSDYSAVRGTPGIDSLVWRKERDSTLQKDGVRIYNNTHDPQNKTRYYRFTYDEVWEFHSEFQAWLKVVNDRSGYPDHIEWVQPGNPQYLQNQFTCWKYNTSENILLASTEKLTSDIVSMYPVTFIEFNTWRISELYSINLKQYAMSVEAFRFYEQLKKNTELRGTIFDPQPSDNNGNFHCINDPNEPVIGFVEVSEEKQKRIFIDRWTQVPEWVYTNEGCQDSLITVSNDLNGLRERRVLGRLPTSPKLMTFNGDIGTAWFGIAECVDCRLRGSSVKPPFWPR